MVGKNRRPRKEVNFKNFKILSSPSNSTSESEDGCIDKSIPDWDKISVVKILREDIQERGYSRIVRHFNPEKDELKYYWVFLDPTVSRPLEVVNLRLDAYYPDLKDNYDLISGILTSFGKLIRDGLRPEYNETYFIQATENDPKFWFQMFPTETTIRFLFPDGAGELPIRKSEYFIDENNIRNFLSEKYFIDDAETRNFLLNHATQDRVFQIFAPD